MYRRAVVIYNPAAGRWWGTRRASRQRQIQSAIEVLRRQAESVEAAPTTGPRSATELARQAGRNGADLVLACGGDGTINEVVNGLAQTSVALGVLPTGTANVLGREIGIPLDPVRAAALLPQLQARRISLGRVGCGLLPQWRYFLLMAGAGVDAQIVYDVNVQVKSYLGILSYWLAGLGRLGRRQQCFRIEVDGQEFECTLAVAAKSSRYGGGFQIARRAHLLAGELQVVLFHTQSSLRYLVYLAGAASGHLHRMPSVTFLKARRLRLCPPADAPEPLRVQADGEYVGCLPAELEIVDDALTLLMPESYLQIHG